MHLNPIFEIEGRVAMRFRVKSVFVMAGITMIFLTTAVQVQAQDLNGFSESHGFNGYGWNGGYWNGSDLVPGDYTKNGIAWGSIGTPDAGMGAGIGYGGGGLGIKLPGQAPVRLGW